MRQHDALQLGEHMARTRTLGYLGFGWALSYLPIHVYWALGGLTSSIGVEGEQPSWRAANWGACVVILGAGLTCLSLVQRWGQVFPRGLRSGTAWVGGLFGIAHWLLYTTFCGLRLAGVVGYPTGHPTPHQLRGFDWANVVYFELWFGVMGALLIACAFHTRPRQRRVARTSPRQRTGTALALAGLGTVVWGVFTFDWRLFAGIGPVLLGFGLLLLISAYQEGMDDETTNVGVPGRDVGGPIRGTARVLGDRSY
jgi:hypothetical protein